MSGHFIAYCRDLWNNNTWYKYNDAIVTQVNDFQSDVVNFAMPYLLFYKKKDDNKMVNPLFNDIFQNNNNNNMFYNFYNMNYQN